MFESEFYSLNDIKNTEAIRVPNPIKVNFCSPNIKFFIIISKNITNTIHNH